MVVAMGAGMRAMAILALMGRFLNEALSFVVFSFFDLLDFLLCFVYKLADFCIESHWKPCYCSSKEAIASVNGGEVLVSEQGGSKVVRVIGSARVQLEDISDTLYTRPSSVSAISRGIIRRQKADDGSMVVRTERAAAARSTFTVNSAIIEMLQGKVGGGRRPLSIPRWSDCDCGTCNSWSSTAKESLFVKAQVPRGGKAREDVLFIHGFISSSVFWTETLFPNFSENVKSSYRLLAVDLLGFGRSPKPAESLYTLREHLDMIHKSVLQPYRVKKSFHIVAHSLGCILALAFAAKHPGSVKSLTLLSPPYFPVPRGEEATQYVLRRIAPRRVWPLIALGASIAGWYEHLSRTVCLLICKNHRLWEILTKFITRNRIRTFLCEGFCCHTHNAAWHTLHNIICGTASKLDGYLDAVRAQVNCVVAIFHGEDDELIPTECSYNVQSRIPRARVKVFKKKDHITIVVGQQEAFARELEKIWRKSSSSG